MATYASNTNPFIKTDKVDQVSERCCKKYAPGMAKPQGLINADRLKTYQDDTSKDTVNQEVEVLSTSTDCDGIIIEEKQSGPPKANGHCNKKEDELLDFQDLVQSVDKEKAKILKNEVAKLSEDLVQAAIKLELGDQKISTDDIRETNSSIKDDCSKIEEQKSDNEDELEADSEQSMEQSSRHHQHIELIKKLRLQLRDLEKYAYERGELTQVPPSVLAERQTVILDTLKDKLSLNICMSEIEKMGPEELKKQIDKDINDLIDPLITKEHLLGQLKTQLTDLERYVDHLHGSLDKKGCLCHLHGCSSILDHSHRSESSTSFVNDSVNLINNDSSPKTTKLIRSLVAQLICSDLKIQEASKKEEALETCSKSSQGNDQYCNAPVTKEPFRDGAAWCLHVDRVILATDSLINLFTLEPQYRKSDKTVDSGLIESIVRRQLVPAIKDLLNYGLFDPNNNAKSTTYTSLLFDPYYILSSLTCLPQLQRPSSQDKPIDKIHVWNVIEDYYEFKSDTGFKNSSVKTLSQSFNLAPSISGPMKITSRQALLIAVDDIIETLAKCKPNGPESHFKAFIYTALNRAKLSTWLRLIFKNKSIVRRYYHNFSFVSQTDKMDKFLKIIEPLGQFEFNLSTDIETIDRFIGAF